MRFSRHTAYARVEPAGMLIARWYCEEGHTTFSLLPDCLALRLSSTLAAVEEVALAVERRAGSMEALAAELRPDIEMQGAVRWVRRRVVAAVVAQRAPRRHHVGLREGIPKHVVKCELRATEPVAANVPCEGGRRLAFEFSGGKS